MRRVALWDRGHYRVVTASSQMTLQLEEGSPFLLQVWPVLGGQMEPGLDRVSLIMSILTFQIHSIYIASGNYFWHHSISMSFIGTSEFYSFQRKLLRLGNICQFQLFTVLPTQIVICSVSMLIGKPFPFSI